MDSHFTCEVCGNGGHLGNDYPETREDCAYLNNNNGYRPQQRGQGWNQPRPPFQGGNNYNPSFNSNFNSNQPPLREFVLGQVKINENINKKLYLDFLAVNWIQQMQQTGSESSTKDWIIHSISHSLNLNPLRIQLPLDWIVLLMMRALGIYTPRWFDLVSSLLAWVPLIELSSQVMKPTNQS